MGTTMNRATYERLIAEDVVWLLQQPRGLERDHIEAILHVSPDREYGPGMPPRRVAPVPKGPSPKDRQRVAEALVSGGLSAAHQVMDELLTGTDDDPRWDSPAGRQMLDQMAGEPTLADFSGTWRDEHSTVRVLAVAEDYLMLRRPRAMVFVRTVKDFLKEFKRDGQH